MLVLKETEFHEQLKAQGVARNDYAFKCPMCGTVQSGRDLVAAGVGETLEEVWSSLGFSCIGRFTGAASPRKKPDGQPCNWSLGGLLRVHELEVETEDGKRHPSFVVASPEEAQAHAKARAAA